MAKKERTAKPAKLAPEQVEALQDLLGILMDPFSRRLVEQLTEAIEHTGTGPDFDSRMDEWESEMRSRLDGLEKKLDGQSQFAEVAKEFGPRLTRLEEHHEDLLKGQSALSEQLQAFSLEPVVHSLRDLEDQVEALGSEAFFQRAKPLVETVADTLDRLRELRADQPEGDLAEHLALLESKLRRGLEAIGVQLVLAAPGDPFDAATMDPFQQRTVDSPERDEAVLETVRTGYRYNGEVRRPADVVVGSYEEGGNQDES